MQPHLGHILLNDIYLLWCAWGNAEILLTMGMQRKIHPSLHNVSAEQFKLDLHWLFGAMKQAITGRGRTIIQLHEETQDGIVAWHEFVTKCRYDGNVDVCLNQQMALTQVVFHAKCPGGAIQFLDDHASACMNIDHVLWTTPTTGHRTSDHASFLTDFGKCQRFMQNFSVLGLTAELIENVESTTQTWDELAHELRRRLAMRMSQNRKDSASRAHLGITHDDLQMVPTMTPNPPIQDFLINQFRQGDFTVFANMFKNPNDWTVGTKLWHALGKELQGQVAEIRRVNKPLPSGGIKAMDHQTLKG